MREAPLHSVCSITADGARCVLQSAVESTYCSGRAARHENAGSWPCATPLPAIMNSLINPHPGHDSRCLAPLPTHVLTCVTKGAADHGAGRHVQVTAAQAEGPHWVARRIMCQLHHLPPSCLNPGALQRPAGMGVYGAACRSASRLGRRAVAITVQSRAQQVLAMAGTSCVNMAQG